MPKLENTSTKSALRVAMEARDLSAIVDAFAPDAEFRSPLTEKLTFKGHEEITAIISVIPGVFEDFHYTDEFGG
jgi:ketosteroid isomerase-like protein